MGSSVAFGIVAVTMVLILGAWTWVWAENRSWIVSRAVDRGRCSDAAHTVLQPRAGARSSRELIDASPACMRQIVDMLATATGFSCHSASAMTVCTHALNGADSTTYVRAIVTPRRALLEVIPT